MELCVPVIVENLRIKKLAWFIETPEFLFFSIIKKEILIILNEFKVNVFRSPLNM